MAFLLLSHNAKPFSKKVWTGDFQTAASWNINFPPNPPKKIFRITWSRPEAGWVKVNSDGAFTISSGKAAAGGLIRDEDGRILKAFQVFIGQSSILYAELVGIWKGIQVCRALGKDSIIF